MDTARKILIVGGTHGNELTGVYLQRKWSADPSPLLSRLPSGEFQFLLANPDAVQICRRYAQTDLNRCFAHSTLAQPASPQDTTEIRRARQIDAAFGPKGSTAPIDLLLDIHNTTANMGITLILSARDAMTCRIAAHLAREFPQVRLFLQPEERSESPYLGTIAQRDICIEVGPQCHGTLCAGLFSSTEKLVLRLFELLNRWNAGNLPAVAGPVEVFTEVGQIDYPRDADGNLAAMVHPSLQGRDYQELAPGAPLFLGMDGKEIPWNGERAAWPVFINEAAYYEKHIAMTLTVKTLENW